MKDNIPYISANNAPKLGNIQSSLLNLDQINCARYLNQCFPLYVVLKLKYLKISFYQ